MIPLPAVDLGVPQPPVAPERHEIAVFQHTDSPHWLDLWSGGLQLGGWRIVWDDVSGHLRPLARPAGGIGQPQEGMGLELVGEEVDAEGHWRQTFRLTVRPGGTLSDASLLIYGDTDHIEEMFHALQLDNPDVTDPGLIRVGQQFEVVVDPTRTFVVRDTLWDEANRARTIVFYNGVHLVSYPERVVGVLRVVHFPPDQPATQFEFPVEGMGGAPSDDTIPVRAGQRLVNYTYDPGDSFRDATEKIYGTSSVRAMEAFIAQSGWDPNDWPPDEQQSLRLVLEPPEAYEDPEVPAMALPLEDPVAAAKLAELTERRARLGIYPIRMEPLGTVYRVAIRDPNVTVRDVTRFLYNSSEPYASVISQAGLSLDEPDDEGRGAGTLLIGRSFEIFVEFDAERFLLAPPARDPVTGVLTTRLVNGTVIETYQIEPPYEGGLVEVVHYPSGYRRVVDYPGSLTVDLLDFAYFVLHPESSELPPPRRQALVREFQAQTLWERGLRSPRGPGDEAEWVRMVESEEGLLLEALVRTNASVSWTQLALFYLGRYPCLIPFAAVIVATALTAMALGAIRLGRVESRRRPG